MQTKTLKFDDRRIACWPPAPGDAGPDAADDEAGVPAADAGAVEALKQEARLWA